MSERYDQLQDDEISALYRETRAVEPPAWLDRRILAAANAAVVSRPAPAQQPVGRRMTRWTVSLALAATVVLTVGVVRMVRESGEFESSLRLERMQSPNKPAAEADARGARQAERSLAYPLPEAAPPVAPAAPAAPATPAAPAAPVSSVESVTSPPTPASPAQLGDERSPAPSSAPAAASPAPPAKPAARKRETMAPSEREQAGETEVAPALEERKAVGASERLSRRSPEQWLQEIAELRRRGRTAEADASLAEFRRRYPDHPLDKLSAPR